MLLQKEFHPILQRVVTLRPSTSTTELRPATKVLHVYSCLFNDQVCSKATLQGNGKVFSSSAYKLDIYIVTTLIIGCILFPHTCDDI